MSSDDQHFLDFLSSITSDVTRAIESQFDKTAIVIRESVQQTTWIPDSIKPARAKLPPARFSLSSRHDHGPIETILDFISEHRAFVAATVAFLGTGGLLLYRRRKQYLRKRRARKSPSGARCEVIVVSGALNSPIARSVIADLERRGFIVYVVTSTAVEEQIVKAEGKSDIVPLHLNITDPFSVQQTIDHFESLFTPTQTLQRGVSPRDLTFAGLLVIPDPTFPTGPVQTLSTEAWADTLNAKILGTIATIQAFLRTISEYRSRLVFLTPATTYSIQPPFHSAEVTVLGALDGFIASLRGELATLGLHVCNIKMGAFEATGNTQALQALGQSETLSWSGYARTLYAQNFLSQEQQINGLGSRRRKGTHLRELNNAVFDAISSTSPWSTVRVGRGSIAYALLGSLVPPSLIRWMLGLRRVPYEHHVLDRQSESLQWERVEKV